MCVCEREREQGKLNKDPLVITKEQPRLRKESNTKHLAKLDTLVSKPG